VNASNDRLGFRSGEARGSKYFPVCPRRTSYLHARLQALGEHNVESGAQEIAVLFQSDRKRWLATGPWISSTRRAGAQLWAERFDIERNDHLPVQDEIVGHLVRAIRLRVTDVEGRRSEHERPRSTDATDLVMRDKVIANRPSSAETMIGARDLYEQALKFEPDQRRDKTCGPNRGWWRAASPWRQARGQTARNQPEHRLAGSMPI
jgi:hypothetical protein